MNLANLGTDTTRLFSDFQCSKSGYSTVNAAVSMQMNLLRYKAFTAVVSIAT